MALPVLACLPGLVGGSPWQDAHDHSPPGRLVKNTRPRSAWPGVVACVLKRLRRTHPGQVLELELERDDGRWIYEVKLLQANGQLLKLDVDAATAQVMQAKRKDGGKDRGKEALKAERDPGRQNTPPTESPR
jgi:hypothetical protein